LTKTYDEQTSSSVVEGLSKTFDKQVISSVIEGFSKTYDKQTSDSSCTSIVFQNSHFEHNEKTKMSFVYNQ